MRIEENVAFAVNGKNGKTLQPKEAPMKSMEERQRAMNVWKRKRKNARSDGIKSQQSRVSDEIGTIYNIFL